MYFCIVLFRRQYEKALLVNPFPAYVLGGDDGLLSVYDNRLYGTCTEDNRLARR